MKVFFDSNFYVSAFLFGGAVEKAFLSTLEGSWRVQYSLFSLAEIRNVSRRLKNPSAGKRGIQYLRKHCLLVPTPVSHHVVPGDPIDTPILRAAVGAGADYLVTRDKELLLMSPVDGLRIIALKDYLQVLRQAGLPVD